MINQIHQIDLFIVITYFACCLLIALYKSQSIKTLREYTLGKGSFSDIVIITTIFATSTDAAHTTGTIEQVYTLGIFYAVTKLFSPIFWLIMAKVYGNNIEQFRGCMSISDIMEKLYDKPGRWVTNIASIFLSIAMIANQGIVIGYILNYFFQIPYHIGVVTGMSILLIYSAFGGIRAVALTDVFQFIVFIIAIPIACSFAYQDVGGYKGIMQVLPKEMMQLQLNETNFLIFLSLIFYTLLPESGGTYIQRFFLAKNPKQLTHCIKIVAILTVFFSFITCFIGFIMRAKIPNIDPQNVFIYFVDQYITVGIKGLIIAGLLAVMMSTADSWLNTTSVLLVHDVIRKIIPLTEAQALKTAKYSSIGIGILAICMALSGKGVMELEWFAGSFWVPLITVPITAGFLHFRTNKYSFISSVIFSVTFTSITGYIVKDLGTISLMFGMMGSIIGLFGMHYLQKSKLVYMHQHTNNKTQ